MNHIQNLENIKDFGQFRFGVLYFEEQEERNKEKK